MKLTCIEDVKYRKVIAFRAGETYHAIIFEETIAAENEQEEKHTLFSIRHPEGWEWFYEHFS